MILLSQYLAKVHQKTSKTIINSQKMDKFWIDVNRIEFKFNFIIHYQILVANNLAFSYHRSAMKQSLTPTKTVTIQETSLELLQKSSFKSGGKNKRVTIHANGEDAQRSDVIKKRNFISLKQISMDVCKIRKSTTQREKNAILEAIEQKHEAIAKKKEGLKRLMINQNDKIAQNLRSISILEEINRLTSQKFQIEKIKTQKAILQAVHMQYSYEDTFIKSLANQTSLTCCMLNLAHQVHDLTENIINQTNSNLLRNSLYEQKRQMIKEKAEEKEKIERNSEALRKQEAEIHEMVKNNSFKIKNLEFESFILRVQTNPTLKVSFKAREQNESKLAHEQQWMKSDRKQSSLMKKSLEKAVIKWPKLKSKVLSMEEIKYYMILQLYPSWKKIIKKLSHNFKGYRDLLFYAHNQTYSNSSFNQPQNQPTNHHSLSSIHHINHHNHNHKISELDLELLLQFIEIKPSNNKSHHNNISQSNNNNSNHLSKSVSSANISTNHNNTTPNSMKNKNMVVFYSYLEHRYAQFRNDLIALLKDLSNNGIIHIKDVTCHQNISKQESNQMNQSNAKETKYSQKITNNGTSTVYNNNSNSNSNSNNNPSYIRQIDELEISYCYNNEENKTKRFELINLSQISKEVVNKYTIKMNNDSRTTILIIQIPSVYQETTNRTLYDTYTEIYDIVKKEK